MDKHDFIVLFVSIGIGISILGGNYLNFQAQQQQHQMTYEENPSLMTLERNRPVRTVFDLEKPQDMDSVTVRIAFREIHPSTTIQPTVNGKTHEAVSDLVGGSVHTFHVDGQDLQQVNELRIDGEFEFSNRALVDSITVRGVTGDQRLFFLIMNIVGIIVLIGPILYVKYKQYSTRNALEKQFPNFLRDVVEGTRAGMSLPQAIKNTQTNNYDDLTPYVDEIAAKLDWGIPFERAMENFAEKTHSDIIQRSVSTIIQTYHAGGNVTSVLETIGNNLKELRQLRKERESQVYGEMVTGYIVYFVFLLVLVLLVKYLLPALTFSGGGGIGAIETRDISSEEIVTQYRSIFQWLIIVQSLFSGLVIGRLSEGELKAGLKHFAVLFGIGYTVAVFLM